MRILLALVIVYYLKWIFAKYVDNEIDGAGSLEAGRAAEDGLDKMKIDNETSDAFLVDFRSSDRSRRHVARRKPCERLAPAFWSNRRRHRRRHNWPFSKFNKKRSRSMGAERKIKIDKLEYEVDENHKKVPDWDPWGHWTRCSVTCGTGRRVRWRHCMEKSCPTKGMKQAQMKPCRRKKCPKGILSWLGIKSKH